MAVNANNLVRDLKSNVPAATAVLRESFDRVAKIFAESRAEENLTVGERESCEALTARFARLCDYLFQRAFRTIDQIELTDEGTTIDRLLRMEKRGVISSAIKWRQLRELRNNIANEYLIESSDQVLKATFQETPELIETADKLLAYIDRESAKWQV
jgi:hypothetical protein